MLLDPAGERPGRTSCRFQGFPRLKSRVAVGQYALIQKGCPLLIAQRFTTFESTAIILLFIKNGRSTNIIRKCFESILVNVIQS